MLLKPPLHDTQISVLIFLCPYFCCVLLFQTPSRGSGSGHSRFHTHNSVFRKNRACSKISVMAWVVFLPRSDCGQWQYEFSCLFTLENINKPKLIMAKWCVQHVEYLIENYERFPCLYNVKSPAYHNKHSRSIALNDFLFTLFCYHCWYRLNMKHFSVTLLVYPSWVVKSIPIIWV